MGNCSSSNGGVSANEARAPIEAAAPLPRSLSGTIEACRGGTVVLSGCGGGYDVVGSAPLLRHFRSVASDVVLTNLTFTDPNLLAEYGAPVPGCGRHVRKIEPGVYFPRPMFSPYFPEALFANAVKMPVYAIGRDATIAEVSSAYRKILAAHGCGGGKGGKAKAIFLAKGGSDVLFTGDERGNAVPAEDMLHLRSVLAVPAEHRAVLTLGFDINCGRGIVPSDVDDRLNQLRESDAVLFEERLSLDREDASYYRTIVSKCDPEQTVVQSLVCAAIEGHRDLYTPEHLVPRIRQNIVPLTDRTATLFGFDMDSVAGGVKYLDRLPVTANIGVVREAIKQYKEASFRRLNGAMPAKAGKPLDSSPSTAQMTPLPPLPEEAPSTTEARALTA